MKRILFILGIAALFQAAASTHRYGLFIGHNHGGKKLEDLKYAEMDAGRMAQLLREFGGFSPENQVVLLAPMPSTVRKEINNLKSRVKALSQDDKALLFIYYSGHGTSKAWQLGSRLLPLKEVKAMLRDFPASFRIGVFDACQSGAITRIKGAKAVAPLVLENDIKVSGRALITSSAENENAQESDELKGSFFTHHLLSGLRGAADITDDRKVSLMEAYQYAYNKTVLHTKDTRGGTQHPNAQFDMEMEGDVVLTDFAARNSGIAFPVEASGHFILVNTANVMAAEFTKEPGAAVTIALEPGTYGLFKRLDRKVSNQEIKVSSDQLLQYREDRMKLKPLKGYAVKGRFEALKPGSEGALHSPFSIGVGFSLLRIDTKLDLKYIFRSLNYVQATYHFRNSYLTPFRDDFNDNIEKVFWGWNYPFYMEHWVRLGAGRIWPLGRIFEAYAQANAEYGWIKDDVWEKKSLRYHYDCPEGGCYVADQVGQWNYKWFNWHSVGADIGIQLKIGRHIGMYCETGAGLFLMKLKDWDFYSRALLLGINLNL